MGQEISEFFFFLIKVPLFLENRCKVNKDRVAFPTGKILAGSGPFWCVITSFHFFFFFFFLCTVTRVTE